MRMRRGICLGYRLGDFFVGFVFLEESLLRQGLDAAGLPRRFAPRNDGEGGFYHLNKGIFGYGRVD